MPTESKAGPRRYAPFGTAIKAAKAPPGLYLVATPIGNLGDVTLRALETARRRRRDRLRGHRVTRKLTERYGITTPLTPYHEHNAAEARPKLLARLADGRGCRAGLGCRHALISDPGYKLVRAARETGHAVTALPGASAVLAAIDGLRIANGPFFFEGFLPPEQAHGKNA